MTNTGEYAEMVCGHKLPDWQKNFLQRCYEEHKRNPNAKLIVSVSQDSYRDFVEKALQYYLNGADSKWEDT